MKWTRRALAVLSTLALAATSFATQDLKALETFDAAWRIVDRMHIDPEFNGVDWPAVRDELLAKQASNGGWLDHYAGGAYSTSMSLIILQMPKRYLPIFQK